IISIKNPDDNKWYCISNFRIQNNNSFGQNLFHYENYFCNEIDTTNIYNEKFPEIDIKNSLDEYQYEAVISKNGPVQILAPAGSGKTRALIYRILHLIRKNIPPSKILALAFNRKAMLEMRERLNSMGIHGVKVYTLHAYGLKIVSHFLKNWKFSKEEDKNTSIRNVVLACLQKEYNFQLKRDQDVLIDFLDALQVVKSTLCPPSEIKLELNESEVDFEKLFNKILKEQFKHKFLEFSDMIYLAVRILFKQVEFRKWLQMQQQYVLVDEFQDLNAAQILMVDILSRPWRNLFVVGDDDQLIYGWRGAETKHILNFEERFGTYQRYILNYNYRSCRSLVLHTKQLITYNLVRVKKNILSKNYNMSDSLELIAGKDIWDEAEKIVNEIEKLIKNGKRPGQIAVLSRYNAYLFMLSLLLEKRKIPYEIPDPSQLLQTAAGRDFMAYFTLAVSPQKAEPWMLKR
ncbi:MAG: ATP-dependent helicase, partial [Calditrichia bacterium]|nr:ATP-dependent helicase [Calditrichia bacterium]